MRHPTNRFLALLIILVSLGIPAWAKDIKNQVIVQITAGTDIKRVADAYDGKVLDTLAGNSYLLEIKRPTPRFQVPGVISVESNAVVAPGRTKGGVVAVSATIQPDWYYGQPALVLIQTPRAQRLSTGKGVIIADINSSVDYSHPALRGHLTGGYDFVVGRAAGATLNQSTAGFLDQSTAGFLDQSTAGFLDQSTAAFLDQSTAGFLDQSTAGFLDAMNPAHGHGTLVAGILAAVAPDAMIMPLRAFDDRGETDYFTIAKAVQWAVDHGAHVINMSFGTLENSSVIQTALTYAQSKGVTLVSSAGNENTDVAQYPAAAGGVISVTATDLRDVKASFANYGKTIDVSAPGAAIIAPYPGGYYAVVSGTSFAAPIVAAEAALIRSASHRGDVAKSIEDGTVKIKSGSKGFDLGKGRIDLLLALDQNGNSGPGGN